MAREKKNAPEIVTLGELLSGEKDLVDDETTDEKEVEPVAPKSRRSRKPAQTAGTPEIVEGTTSELNSPLPWVFEGSAAPTTSGAIQVEPVEPSYTRDTTDHYFEENTVTATNDNSDVKPAPADAGEVVSVETVGDAPVRPAEEIKPAARRGRKPKAAAAPAEPVEVADAVVSEPAPTVVLPAVADGTTTETKEGTDSNADTEVFEGQVPSDKDEPFIPDSSDSSSEEFISSKSAPTFGGSAEAVANDSGAERVVVEENRAFAAGSEQKQGPSEPVGPDYFPEKTSWFSSPSAPKQKRPWMITSYVLNIAALLGLLGLPTGLLSVAALIAGFISLSKREEPRKAGWITTLFAGLSLIVHFLAFIIIAIIGLIALVFGVLLNTGS